MRKIELVFVMLTAFSTAAYADINRIDSCAIGPIQSAGFWFLDKEVHSENHVVLKIRNRLFEQLRSARDIVSEDESRGGNMYDLLLASIDKIKSCSSFHGRMDIYDHNGDPIVKGY